MAMKRLLIIILALVGLSIPSAVAKDKTPADALNSFMTFSGVIQNGVAVGEGVMKVNNSNNPKKITLFDSVSGTFNNGTVTNAVVNFSSGWVFTGTLKYEVRDITGATLVLRYNLLDGVLEQVTKRGTDNEGHRKVADVQKNNPLIIERISNYKTGSFTIKDLKITSTLDVEIKDEWVDFFKCNHGVKVVRTKISQSEYSDDWGLANTGDDPVRLDNGWKIIKDGESFETPKGDLISKDKVVWHYKDGEISYHPDGNSFLAEVKYADGSSYEGPIVILNVGQFLLASEGYSKEVWNLKSIYDGMNKPSIHDLQILYRGGDSKKADGSQSRWPPLYFGTSSAPSQLRAEAPKNSDIVGKWTMWVVLGDYVHWIKNYKAGTINRPDGYLATYEFKSDGTYVVTRRTLYGGNQKDSPWSLIRASYKGIYKLEDEYIRLYPNRESVSYVIEKENLTKMTVKLREAYHKEIKHLVTRVALSDQGGLPLQIIKLSKDELYFSLHNNCLDWWDWNEWYYGYTPEVRFTKNLKSRKEFTDKVDKETAENEKKYKEYSQIEGFGSVLKKVKSSSKAAPAKNDAESFFGSAGAANDENSSSDDAEEDEEIYQVVEEMPAFPGGMAECMKFISNNISKKDGMQGKVLVKFVVDKDGSVYDPVVVNKVDAALGREAIRVISRMPKWKPGKQRGKPVRVWYTVPVNF
jgi:protein TonB